MPYTLSVRSQELSTESTEKAVDKIILLVLVNFQQRFRCFWTTSPHCQPFGYRWPWVILHDTARGLLNNHVAINCVTIH